MPFERMVHIMFSTKKEEMKKAIDEAWSNPTKEQKLFQERYFPNGEPTAEEFIKTVSNIIKEAIK